MTRRELLAAFAGAIAGAAFDEERALWRPGKLISIPKPRQVQPAPSVEILCRLIQDEMNKLTTYRIEMLNAFDPELWRPRRFSTPRRGV